MQERSCSSLSSQDAPCTAFPSTRSTRSLTTAEPSRRHAIHGTTASELIRPERVCFPLPRAPPVRLPQGQVGDTDLLTLTGTSGGNYVPRPSSRFGESNRGPAFPKSHATLHCLLTQFTRGGSSGHQARRLSAPRPPCRIAQPNPAPISACSFAAPGPSRVWCGMGSVRDAHRPYFRYMDDTNNPYGAER